MPTLRPIALALLLASACSKDAPADPKPEAAETPAPQARSTPPPLDPHAMAKAEDDEPALPPLDPSMGTFDVTIDGTLTHLRRIPAGQNRAVIVPDAGVARVSIAAAEGHDPWPHLRIVLEGLTLDAVQLPLTLRSDAETPKDVGVSVRYQVNDNRIYTEEGAAVSVTLESFQGSTLRGRFEGTLAPTAAGLGDPIPVSGKFEVQLGLKGVSPGPNPDGGSPEAAPDGGSPEAAPDGEG